MLSLLLSVLGIIFTLFFIIGTHEGAHFLMARWLNVEVLRFSIGFGKSLFSFHDKRKTEYVLAMIPLGGYVKMLDEREGAVPPEKRHLAFNRQPFYKKCLIVLAGPCINIFCAFVLYWIIFVVGFTNVKPVIGTVTPHSIADIAGLKSNQEIVSIDQQKTSGWTAIAFRILMHVGNQDHLAIETKNLTNQKQQIYLLDLTNWHMDELSPDPLKSLGITPYVPKTPHWPDNLLMHIQYSPLAAIPHAFKQIIDFTYFNFLIFGKMLTGKLSLHSLGGPLTIFESAGQALNNGLLSYVSFLAFISIAIGIINLLPIPGLDGGHILIQCIECIIRRPLPEHALIALYYMGLLFILFIFIQAVANDLQRLI